MSGTETLDWREQAIVDAFEDRQYLRQVQLDTWADDGGSVRAAPPDNDPFRWWPRVVLSVSDLRELAADAHAACVRSFNVARERAATKAIIGIDCGMEIGTSVEWMGERGLALLDAAHFGLGVEQHGVRLDPYDMLREPDKDVGEYVFDTRWFCSRRVATDAWRHLQSKRGRR